MQLLSEGVGRGLRTHYQNEELMVDINLLILVLVHEQ